MKKPSLRKPNLSRRQKYLTILGIILLIAAMVFGIMKFRDTFAEKPESQNTAEDQSTEEIQEDPTEDETEPKDQTPAPKPTTDPAGPTEGAGSLTWVVNKKRPLNPKTYIPPNLTTPNVKLRTSGSGMQVRSDVAAAVEKLFAGAKAAGHTPMLSSGYRSYSTQASLYNSYVAQDGQAAADTYSARPGYSEHQTGLAFDICNANACSLEESFGGTPLGAWIASHAHEYGFTIRYKQGKQAITGYTYEPWHLRYVGVSLATQLFGSGKTLEEHFGLPAAPSY